jgi:hypothetical protein
MRLVLLARSSFNVNADEFAICVLWRDADFFRGS